MNRLTVMQWGTLGLIFVAAVAWAGGKNPVNTNWRGLAIKGYDPVAYFTLGKPQKGAKDFELRWQEARWRFVSQDHLERFQADPERYAPQYGGYCAWAVAQGKTAGIDPKRWKIVDGHLYLNYNADIQKRWEADIPGFIQKANANWPGVLN